MRIVRFDPSHLWQIRAQAHQVAVVSRYLTDQYAEILSAGLAYTGFDGTRVVACAGIVTQFAGVGTLWGVLADDSRGHFLAIHRTALRVLGMARLRRLEASSEVDFPQGCRWLELLGFQSEGVMRSYGPDGKDHHRYARITWPQPSRS